MIDHLKLHVSDVAASRAFYQAPLEPLGYRVML
jgi:catechol 2,3-dioxygenase-like lactoylglutathione lyase family enzyme